MSSPTRSPSPRAYLRTVSWARAIACRIAEALDIVGLVAVEMFVTDGEVLVNEIAPRPHNSGHWTLDACVTSQFEQVVRAVCGLPLGSPERFADAEMRNLLGDAADGWQEILGDPAARLRILVAIQPFGETTGHTSVDGLEFVWPIDIRSAVCPFSRVWVR